MKRYNGPLLPLADVIEEHDELTNGARQPDGTMPMSEAGTHAWQYYSRDLYTVEVIRPL